MSIIRSLCGIELWQNVMIHDYDTIDLTIVWDTIQRDLPPLITELEKTVPPEEQEKEM